MGYVPRCTGAGTCRNRRSAAGGRGDDGRRRADPIPEALDLRRPAVDRQLPCDGVVALDWQTVGVAPPLRDVAYFATGLRMISRFAVVTGAKMFPIYARNFIDAYLDGHDSDRQPQIIALYSKRWGVEIFQA